MHRRLGNYDIRRRRRKTGCTCRAARGEEISTRELRSFSDRACRVGIYERKARARRNFYIALSRQYVVRLAALMRGNRSFRKAADVNEREVCCHWKHRKVEDTVSFMAVKWGFASKLDFSMYSLDCKR